MLYGLPQGFFHDFSDEFTAELRLCAQQSFLQCPQTSGTVPSSGYRVLRLALTLEDFARLAGTGGRPAVLDLNLQVQELWDQVDTVLRRRCRPSLDLGTTFLPVLADPQLLNTTLLHLIHNALRYAKPPIRIRCRAIGSHAVVTVEDGGPQLPLPESGYGLGLRLAGLFARRSGGVLLLEHSRANRTRAILSLPLSSSDTLSDPPRQALLRDRFSPLFILLSDFAVLPD